MKTKIIIHKGQDVVYQTLSQLPENAEDVPELFYDLTSADVAKIIHENTVINKTIKATSIKNGKNRYSAVLHDLERLKDQLGGSSFFRSERPTIDSADDRKVFLGIPMPAIKDWFRKILRDAWLPQFFWTKIASSLGVTKNDMSQYEEAHVRIQRFGMLTENMAYFQKILDTQDEERYGELCSITGLAWHPTQNGPGTEKMYMEFIDKFLTEYYEDAKKKGDDALVKYFHAFDGVCFEDRARKLEQYALLHPLAQDAEDMDQINQIADWSESDKVEDAWIKETVLLAQKLQRAPYTLSYCNTYSAKIFLMSNL